MELSINQDHGYIRIDEHSKRGPISTAEHIGFVRDGEKLIPFVLNCTRIGDAKETAEVVLGHAGIDNAVVCAARLPKDWGAYMRWDCAWSFVLSCDGHAGAIHYRRGLFNAVSPYGGGVVGSTLRPWPRALSGWFLKKAGISDNENKWPNLI